MSGFGVRICQSERPEEMLTTYRELEVWQSAIDLVAAVYAMSKAWPDSERFGLISQAQRASVSIPANIAEGYGRAKRGEYLHHLSIARGSLAELETIIVIAVRLGHSQRDDAAVIWSKCQTVGRLLNGQIRSLKASAVTPHAAKRSTEPRTPTPEPHE